MTTQPKATPRNFLRRFGAVGMCLLAIQLDYWALALALPSMADDLDISSTDLQWAISAYMIAVGIAMVPGSRIADLVGRKRMLIGGVVIFGLSSLAIGLSPSVEFVILGRIIQGFGTGLYQPVAWSLVTNETNEVERPKMLGFMSAVGGLGTAAGPLIGGGFADTLGWRWIFFINVPIALIAAIWGSKQLRESKDSTLVGKSLRKLDWFGAAAFGTCVFAITIAIDDASIEGLSWMTYLPIIISAAALIIFIRWEPRSSWPLIPPSIWRNRKFTALVIASAILNMGLSVMIFLSTIYLQDVNGYSGFLAGLMFIPATIGMAVGGPFGGYSASRIPAQRLMTVGMIGGALTLAALGIFSNFVAVLLTMGVATFFLGIGFHFGSIAVQSVVPRNQAGAAAGTLLTIMVTMGGVGVVIASAIYDAVSGGDASQQATTITYLCWAIFIAALGIAFGIWQWKGASLAAPAANRRLSQAETN